MKKILIILFLVSVSIFSQTEEQSFYTFKQNALKQISESDLYFNEVISDNVKKKKSAGLAVLYSFLLPGMGELYADAYSSGVYFTVADGVLWGTYIGINVYGNWQQDRYINYAQLNAGITPDGKDDNYYAAIGQYMNIEQYNDEKALERSFDQMYNTSQDYWKWNSSEDRKSYRSMWLSSENSFNNVRFVVGALLLNRVISAINAVRLVSKYNNNLTQEVGWNIYLGVQSNPDQSSSYNLNFSTPF